MPIVAVGVKRLNELLGSAARPPEELSEFLGNLGCDVEDMAEVVHYQCPLCHLATEKLAHEAPPKRCDHCDAEQPFPLSEIGRLNVIRLDLLADRPDLFEVGGISRALKGILGVEKGLPRYAVEEGLVEILVDPALESPGCKWPYIFAAEVIVPPLDQESLRELMRFQESLHWGIARDRKLCAIGVYDLDTIQSPIRFTCLEKDEPGFAPLAHGATPLTGRQILEQHPKGKAYAHLLESFERYPLLIDAKGQVLSMPPIINSEETRVRLGSTRLLVESTGIVADAARNAMHTLVSSMAELGAKVRSVCVVRPDGYRQTWPALTPKSKKIDPQDACRWLGLDLSTAEVIELFQKMRLDAEEKDHKLVVHYPAYRTDVRHPVDLYADLAIGYGYENLPLALTPTMTPSEQRFEERLASQVRTLMMGFRFWEVMSLVQTTNEKHFAHLRLNPEETPHVLIGNPKSADVNIVRCHLMTGILETLHKNRKKAMPQQFFEIGNVVLLQDDAETGTAEEKRLCFAIIGPDAGYAAIRAVADGLCRELGVKASYQKAIHPSFVEGRLAFLDAAGSGALHIQGRLGELHPEVLENFGLLFPVALAELTLCRVV